MICHGCSAEDKPLWAVTYRRNIGMLIAHQRQTASLQLCRGCVHREYWKRVLILSLVGWTSYYSIVIGPVFMLMNAVNYVRALAGQPLSLPPAAPPLPLAQPTRSGAPLPPNLPPA